MPLSVFFVFTTEAISGVDILVVSSEFPFETGPTLKRLVHHTNWLHPSPLKFEAVRLPALLRQLRLEEVHLRERGPLLGQQ